MTPRGLSCPNCGCTCLRVVKLYRPCAGVFFRTRECQNCKRRWVTEEKFRTKTPTPQK